MPRIRTYSRTTRITITMLGNLIRIGRIQRRMTANDLAERIGISRATLNRIEMGEPTSAIGIAFEAALIVGVRLFEYDERVLEIHARYLDEKLTLLPRNTRNKPDFDDDF